ncbi:aminotransferase class I/II-fold pyridoxal phosphate-dependent enzyme [Zhihengliuella salsuginis]|uniref:Aminotransferase n=1 Tax=Zhihengliuella salsuginis TaxID=578222 RepID=A0ABQ3GJZ9_9MICC|nr:aminotransferase class I/II-fold pyridoxal phosphate-dependent enzyme [Zhihengliuella salsuginis]GHD11705.1 aminotransferase [Zhihengliuella salsuginis]
MNHQPTPQTTAPWQRAATGANLLGADGSIKPTIFEELTALALEHGAINLGQGFPDTDGPEELKRIAERSIRSAFGDGGLNQYAPGLGLPALRDSIVDHQRRFYGRDLDAGRNVLVTTGATEGIAASILALVSPGDRVVTLSPFYDSYAAMIGLAGGEHATVGMRWPDFAPADEEIDAAITAGTRLVIVNTPHNPTGTALSRGTLERIVSRAAEVGALILSDEVYEHLVFDGPHLPVAAIEGAAERTLTLGSAGKTFSLTGWKVGWVTGPAELITAVRSVKQFLSYSSGGPFQAAVAQGLAYDDAYFRGQADRLRAGRDVLVAALRSAGLTVSDPAAGYFAIADVSSLGFEDASALAYRLPEELGIAAIPVSAFVQPHEARHYSSLLRFAFCKREDVLQEAAERLKRLPELMV